MNCRRLFLRAVRTAAPDCSFWTSSRPARSTISQTSHWRGYSTGAQHQKSNLTKKFTEGNDISSQSWTYYAFPAVVVLFAGVVTFIHYNDEKRAIPKGTKQNTLPERSLINRPAIGGPFMLYDTENNLVTESNLRGKWTLMYFGYTSCPVSGPEEVKKIAEVINLLDVRYKFKLNPVFITIDPQRDSPDQLRAYLNEFDPKIMGLTGPVGSVRQAAQEYRVFFKKVDEIGQDYLIECSQNMYLIDPNLETVRCFGAEYRSSQLADAIMSEVAKASAPNLAPFR